MSDRSPGEPAKKPAPNLNPLHITPEQWAGALKETAEDERQRDQRIAQRIAQGAAARDLSAPPAQSSPAPNPVAYMLSAYDSTGHTTPPDQLLASYARGPADLEAALAGMTPAHLRTRPTPEQAAAGAGTWSPLQLVGHLADCDQFLADRIKRTLAYGKAATGTPPEIPLLVGVDENKYFAAFDYHARDLAEELTLLRTTRSQITRLLQPLTSTPGVWQYQAHHTEAGPMTLHKILFHAAYHIPHHLAYLHKKRAAFGIG